MSTEPEPPHLAATVAEVLQNTTKIQNQSVKALENVVNHVLKLQNVAMEHVLELQRADARLMDQIEALRKDLTATENEALAEYTRRLDEGYHPVTGKRLLTPEQAETMCNVARHHLRSRIVAALERSDDSALREFAQRVRNKEV